MAGKSNLPNSWFSVVLIIAAAALWFYNQPRKPSVRPTENPTVTQTTSSAPPKATPVQAESTNKSAPRSSRRYEIHQNCTLAQARNNDGDSFQVRLPNGEKAEFRLYFVDTPESAFKRYAGGDSNHERIRQQAAEMGGITPEQAVEVGKKGKQFTLDLLASHPFTLYTEWDSPFKDHRYHAHIKVLYHGKSRWLHQVLVEKGLARIKTKGADLPDGSSMAKEKEHLRALERNAKQEEAGVWGL